MSRPFDIHLPLELAYRRSVLLAIEILDAVTLGRVRQGVKVTATGLKGLPIVNAGGLFVWLREGQTAPQTVSVSIEPGILPLERVEISATQVRMPLSIVELPPRSDYPFPAGITGIRAALVEQRVTPPARPEPVTDAELRLAWLDDDGVTWHDSPVRSHTSPRGDFAAILRFAPSEVPSLDANGALSVRLRVIRAGQNELGTAPFPLPQGRVADALTYAWDELKP